MSPKGNSLIIALGETACEVPNHRCVHFQKPETGAASSYKHGWGRREVTRVSVKTVSHSLGTISLEVRLSHFQDFAMGVGGSPTTALPSSYATTWNNQTLKVPMTWRLGERKQGACHLVEICHQKRNLRLWTPKFLVQIENLKKKKKRKENTQHFSVLCLLLLTSAVCLDLKQTVTSCSQWEGAGVSRIRRQGPLEALPPSDSVLFPAVVLLHTEMSRTLRPCSIKLLAPYPSLTPKAIPSEKEPVFETQIPFLINWVSFILPQFWN